MKLPISGKIKYILLGVIIFIGNYGCSKEVDSLDSMPLYYLLLQNPSSTEISAILEIQARDFTSYEGICLDSFFGISAGAYMNVQYPPEIRNLEFRKIVGTKKNCSQLGFVGGVENRIDGTNTYFKSYSCNPMSSLCKDKAILEAGFTQ